MNIYIYDDYLNKSKYSRILNRVEIRLTDLGLNGKIIRLGAIKNIRDVIQNEIKNGAKTIVAVGNNQTVNKIIGSVIDNELYGFFQKNILFSIIPIGEDNSIADSLGIRKEEEACNILLARRVKKIDIGIVNNYYFLNKATIPCQDTVLEIAGEYSIESQEKGVINIFNLKSDTSDDKNLKINPIDGKLDVYIKNKNRDLSFISTKKIKITNPNYPLVLDGIIEIKTPADIGIISGKLNVVVGKDRSFE
ncbi:MAG: diacylglycerol kinase family protein [Candidatus Falkowbacteria bacterium]